MPVFTWKKIDSEPYELNVSFSDGATDTVLLRRKTYSDGTQYDDILYGTLKIERTTQVSVEGKAGDSNYDVMNRF